MTKLKKGLSLLAAAAFLITALIPVSGLAAQRPATTPWQDVFTSVPGQSGVYQLGQEKTIEHYMEAPSGPVTVDLCGNTLRSTDDLAIMVFGTTTLTIKDSKGGGEIAGATGEGAAAITVWDTATLVLESGTISGGGARGATVALNGRTEGKQATLEVKGGAIDGADTAIGINPNFGAKVAISGGTVKGLTAIFQNGNATTEATAADPFGPYREYPSYVTISGGTVEGTDPSLSGNAGITWQNQGTLTINGGTITARSGPGVLVRDGVANINGGTIRTQGTGTCTEGDSGGNIPPAPVVWDEGEKSKANYLKGGEPAQVTVANGVKLEPASGIPAMAHVTGGQADGTGTAWTNPAITFTEGQKLAVAGDGTVSGTPVTATTTGWNWTPAMWAAQSLVYGSGGN